MRKNLIPTKLTKQQIGYIYANEAGLLSVALLGKTIGQRVDNENAQLVYQTFIRKYP